MTRDIRYYSSQTTRHLIIGGLFLIILVAILLIYWFFGKEAALFGLVCIALGLLPSLLIIMIFWILQKLIDLQNKS